ncbi:MAG: GNAT family N-acetyltransferase [Planctomycetales bacterium]|nr:GNAT family N-acetyltransferase [Planctomycetales bacterium]
MPENNVVQIVSLTPEYAQEAARLHIEGINQGFISSLGIDFVTALYRAIAQDPQSFGYVAVKEGKVVGFATFTANLKGLYKSIMKKNGFQFAFLLFRKLVSWRIIQKVFETLFYPSRIKKYQFPEAEFLSMSVSPEARGHGLATRFVEMGFNECQKRGIQELKILAAVTIGPINKMYEKFGFKTVAHIENHGIVSNVYVVRTDHFAKS